MAGCALSVVNFALNIVLGVRPIDSTPLTWWTAMTTSSCFVCACLESLFATHWVSAVVYFVMAIVWWPKQSKPKRDEEKARWKMPAWMEAMMKPPPRLADYGPA